MPAASKCPVCDWKIEKPVKVATPQGSVEVCCDECAEKLRAQPAARPAPGSKAGGRARG